MSQDAITPQTSPRERALRYADFGNQTAVAIRDAIFRTKPADYDELFCYASRIALCNARQNQWYATDLHNEHGEAYDGAGKFWNCGHKLCSSCLKKHVNRSRKLISAAIDRQRLLVGHNWNFITLTIVNHGLPMLTQRELVNRAWAHFRKSPWYKRTIKGAAKTEEFTLTKRGYHYHLHLIAITKYVEYARLRAAWTQAAQTAHAEMNIPLQINTSDGLLQANCKRVGSLKDAVMEVAKYITKACSWKQMDPEQLLDACRVSRWPRMFELVGCMKPTTAEPEAAAAADGMNIAILDERLISDDRPNAGWRRRITEVGADDYLQELRDHWQRQCGFRVAQLKRKFTAASFYALRGPPLSDPTDFLHRLDTAIHGTWHGPKECRGWRMLDDGGFEVIYD